MFEVIGRTAVYDFILASHVIEHAPDIIGFLKDCAALLKPGGILVLAVPDMRYCFDRYRPRSSLGAIVEAHREQRHKQSRASLFDRIAYNNRLDDRAGWSKTCAGIFRLQFDLKDAPAYAARHETEGYIDGHSWQFTPSSFRALIEDMSFLGIIDLREKRFVETPIFEFFVVLSANGAGPGLSRIELLEAMMDEQARASSLFSAAERELARLAQENVRLKTERDALGAAQASMSPLASTIDTTERETTNLLLRIRRTQEHADQYQAERDALLRSRSWRMTAPFRAAVSALRKSLS